MAIDWSEFVDMADEMIEEFGRPATLVKMSRTAADTEKPWRGPPQTTVDDEIDVTALFLGDVERDGERATTRTGGVEGVLVATADLGGADLKTYDYVNDGGNLMRIASASPLKPGTTTVLWGLELEA